MSDNEAIVIDGVRKFSDHQGYANSFRYLGPSKHKKSSSKTIISIDGSALGWGLIRDQQDMMLRDLNKAFVGFMNCRSIGESFGVIFFFHNVLKYPNLGLFFFFLNSYWELGLRCLWYENFIS